MIFSNSSPNVHFRHKRLCLREHINNVILFICALFIGIACSWKCLYGGALDVSRHEKRVEKRYFPQKMYKTILDVQLLFGALGSLDEGVMNCFL